jgi:hypothetical protein
MAGVHSVLAAETPENFSRSSEGGVTIVIKHLGVLALLKYGMCKKTV